VFTAGSAEYTYHSRNDAVNPTKLIPRYATIGIRSRQKKDLTPDRKMRIEEFDYELPERLIAQKPLPKRDQSRMMVLDRQTGKITHARFVDFPTFLHTGDVVVLNNSRVIPARAWGKNQDKTVEFLFLKEVEGGQWEVLCRPAKKINRGDTISFSPRLKGRVTQEKGQGLRLLDFSHANVLAELKKIGFAPLPPYIKRTREQSDLRDFDLDRYQTVFAHQQGSIAAPTAGLHFTPGILKEIQEKGSEIVHISLDVGLATFQPVRVETVEELRMLEETYTIHVPAADIINRAKQDSRPVIAVGTTSVRTLESAAQNGEVKSGIAATRLFIHPGYTFKIVNRLLTNFHLPKSTLLMLTSAFAGHEFVMKAYREAVENGYRFYSYGDCMLIL
jgi:S-adenosylmethionine:tRNA ribosyltransferase-isomerase